MRYISWKTNLVRTNAIFLKFKQFYILVLRLRLLLGTLVSALYMLSRLGNCLELMRNLLFAEYEMKDATDDVLLLSSKKSLSECSFNFNKMALHLLSIFFPCNQEIIVYLCYSLHYL